VNPFMQGVELSILGISITFGTLGLLVVLMKLLQHFFSPQPDKPTSVAVEPSAAAVEVVAPTDADEEQRVAAAIAAAVTHLRALSRARSGLGQSFSSDPGGWWMAGQMGNLSSTVAQRTEGE
jgi:sodium pump decarboxylase gamma subunit